MKPYTIDQLICKLKELNKEFGNDPVVIMVGDIDKEFMNPVKNILMAFELKNELQGFNVDEDSLLITCAPYDRTEETIIHTAEMLCELEKLSREGYGDRRAIIYGGGIQFHWLQTVVRLKYKPDWPYAVYLTGD